MKSYMELYSNYALYSPNHLYSKAKKIKMIEKWRNNMNNLFRILKTVNSTDTDLCILFQAIIQE